LEGPWGSQPRCKLPSSRQCTPQVVCPRWGMPHLSTHIPAYHCHHYPATPQSTHYLKEGRPHRSTAAAVRDKSSSPHRRRPVAVREGIEPKSRVSNHPHGARQPAHRPVPIEDRRWVRHCARCASCRALRAANRWDDDYRRGRHRQAELWRQGAPRLYPSLGDYQAIDVLDVM
jgi:hypothetical protein